MESGVRSSGSEGCGEEQKPLKLFNCLKEKGWIGCYCFHLSEALCIQLKDISVPHYVFHEF